MTVVGAERDDSCGEDCYDLAGGRENKVPFRLERSSLAVSMTLCSRL